MSTALDKLGTPASAQVGDLKVTFHNANHLSDQTLGYYDHIFDLSPHDVSNRLPGLTKLTLVAPVYLHHASQRHLQHKCHRSPKSSHETLLRFRGLPSKSARLHRGNNRSD